MGDPSSLVSPSASAEEYLSEALAGLRDTAKLGLLLDPDSISALVACCQSTAPENASEILSNILFEEGKAVIDEYLRRRLATVKPSSVNNSIEEPLKVYRKPDISAAASCGGTERKQDGRKTKDAVKNQLSNSTKNVKPCDCQARKHKLVNNCLSCGKIICEQEGFGPCTFCGTELYSSARLEMSEEEAKANVFKDRILGYDQSGHQHTTVIDDQSFSPDIEGNAWMSPEEKKALQREKLEEAAKLHRNKMVLLLDPAGGKVSISCEDDIHKSNGSSIISGINDQIQNFRIMSNPSIKECPVYVDTGKPAQRIQSRDTKIPERTKVISGRVQHDEQLGASYLQPLTGRVELQKCLTPVEDEMLSCSLSDTESLGRAELQKGFTPVADESSRHLSPDIQSLAGTAGLQIGFSAVADERSRHLMLQTGKKISHEVSSSAFDICVPKNKAVSRGQPIKLSSSLLVQNREKKRDLDYKQEHPMFQYLMPGMVLLKNWLSQNDQVNIVRTCRTLGVGPGGFYQPGYGDSNKMHLWMMCLGKNWDPTSRSYEDIRSYDNAVPPPLPAEFMALAERAVEAAHGAMKRDKKLMKIDALRVLPRVHPDICLVNFYKDTGRLGMHQDKDESRSSINRGIPVVSFSLGDSAEFVYGIERGEEQAERVTLESGDVLIFGGPSRLIFHGITRVHPHTSPGWLNKETGLCPGRINLTFRQL